MTGGGKRRLSDRKQIEVFKRSHHARQGQAQSRAPVYQAVSILSGVSIAGCVRRHLSVRTSISGSPSHISGATCGAPGDFGAVAPAQQVFVGDDDFASLADGLGDGLGLVPAHRRAVFFWNYGVYPCFSRKLLL